jgi:peptide/nickel transport system substrate-binding protein
VRNVRPIAGLAVAAVLLTACHGHGSDHSQSQATASPFSGSALFDPARQAPAAPIAGARHGGTITVLLSDQSSIFDPQQRDPSAAYTFDAVSILSSLVTRSLTQQVYDPATKSTVLIPDLATDLGTPNADFTKWTFTIRSGVMYENGDPVTAQDVAFGIERSFDRKDFPDGAPYSNNYFLDGHTYGGPYQAGGGTDYPGVAVDGDTLTLTMDRPFPDLPYWASYPAIGPLPQSGSNPATYGQHPLATGPYMFQRHPAGNSVTLVRNPNWDPATDPGRHAYPDRFVFLPRADAERVDATLLGNSAQGATMVAAHALTQDFAEGRRLGRLTANARPCTYMGFPDYRTVTDIRVRMAIAYAYPYKQAAALASRYRGATLPRIPSSGTSLLPPGFPGRQDYNVLGTPPGTTHPAKARALLEQAGYKPGEYMLRWPFQSDNAVVVRVTNAAVKAFEAAGFAAKPHPTSTSTFGAVAQDPHGPFNLRFAGWCSDWRSGSTWFPFLFRNGPRDSPVDFGDYAFFDEPDVDAEIKRIESLPLGEQADAWGALDKMVATTYFPGFVTSYARAGALHGSRIGGMELDDVLLEPTWRDMYVIG